MPLLCKCEPIKRGAAPAQTPKPIILSWKKLLLCTCIEMAPCSSNFSFMQHARISERENIKLRKPVVEKMRRDRINSCIEQLKLILEKEFHKQEPNSKLEKADILEMTVSFLRQQLQPTVGANGSDYSRGYSHCWRDSLHFLSTGSAGASARAETIRGDRSPSLEFSPGRGTRLQDSSGCPVWRPW
ncbi:transcription factor HES-5-like [Corythoichthys intestinalis]|uniref:transcription factor HES-5-like n=1 Tax=Corythoichthys intestinalis TaxID=161448 RepID=UPI0025A596F8|nr:transcription factor HES-5-like [Corythoichthys intestinalis]